MNLSTSCLDASQVESLLHGNLAPEESEAAQNHVEQCETCRARVESTIGPQEWWNEVQSVLLNSRSRSFSTHHDFSTGSEPAESSSSKLLDLLGPTDDPNMLGRIGPFEIIGLLGQGGMGAVFKGFDRSLNRFVAIKMLLPHLAASGAARKRFAREGQAVAAVVDDHVMAIHCVDEWQGVPYLVMTYSRGVSLQRRLSDNGPLEVREILRIGMQTAKGLAAAHAQGIVHRDIKPANIFLDQTVERVQLMDFGLARAVDDASLTRTGVLAGTPQYMSPEQARAETVDHRSDLFSLGSVMYAMCTGHAPFRAESSYGVLRLITDKEPRAIREINPDIPEWLCAIITKLMAKQACERYSSAKEFSDLLEDCLAHVQQPAAKPLPVAVTALDPKRIRRPPIGKLIAAAAFAFVLLLAGVFIVLELNKGTLTIQSDADDVRVRITHGNEIVNVLRITKGEKSIRVAAGQYNVEVVGKTDGLTVENGKVTLHRADTEVVKIIHTTPDDNLPTYNAPAGAVQAYQSNSGDSLSETIDQFNFLRTKDPLNDQSPLTKDELIACAAWNLEFNHELTRTLRAALGEIARHQWPEGWRINGGYLDLPPDATPVRAYRISLVHPITDEVFTVRERFIEPPSAYANPVYNTTMEGTQLRAAVERFNARFNQANGHKQPPLTDDEVVAAIVHHQAKRDEAYVSDALFEKFQRIARERYLPEGTSLEVIPTFGVEDHSTYTIWSVRIKMFQDEPGKEGWTYAFEIREQFVSVKHRDAAEIHWGQPAKNGLQAGVQLSPPLLSYELGQKIDVQLLYRNILTKPIAAGVPNFCGYELAVHDTSGAKMEVFDLQELVVGGARSQQIESAPISSPGRSLAFAPSSLATDKREEYSSKTGASILILVEPGKSYRMQFTVGNVAEDAEGTIKSGEIEVAIGPEVNDPESSVGLKMSAKELDVVSRSVPTEVRGTGSVTITLPAKGATQSSSVLEAAPELVDLSTPQATLEYIDRRKINNPTHVPVDCYTDDALLEMSGVMLQQLGYMSVLSQIYSPVDAQLRTQAGGDSDAKDSGQIIPGAIPSYHVQFETLLKEHSHAAPPEECKQAFESICKWTIASLDGKQSRVIPDRQLYRLAAGILKSPKEFLPKAGTLCQFFRDSSRDESLRSAEASSKTQYDIVINGDEATATAISENGKSTTPLKFKLRRVNQRWLVSEAFSDEILKQINLSMPQMTGDVPAIKTEGADQSPEVTALPPSTTTIATLQPLLCTWEQVQDRVAEIVKEREAIANAEVDFKLDSDGQNTSERQYHVWLNDRHKRGDCRGVSSDAAEDYTHIVTPNFNWYEDHLDKSKSQMDRRDPTDPVGWGTLGCIVDVRKIGLVNWSIESIDTYEFDHDLLPKDRTETLVETGDDEGAPITIVKHHLKSTDATDRWTEYWLSPKHGNYPIYIANGWTEPGNPTLKNIVSQRTQWEFIDGIWFPRSVKHHYLSEHRKLDETSTFTLTAARFNVLPFPDVFALTELPSSHTTKRVAIADDSLSERGTDTAEQPNVTGDDELRDAATAKPLVNVKLISFETQHLPVADGKGIPMQELIATIRNDSDHPIRSVFARMSYSHSSGGRSTLYNVPIYTALDSEPGIAPGETGVCPRKRGWSFATADGLHDWKIEIVEVSEKNALHSSIPQPKTLLDLPRLTPETKLP